MGLTNMAEASNIICDPEDGEDTLLSWLKRASLEKYQTTFAENGITEIANLEDVKEEDAIPLGLTKFEARRLARVYTGWKTTQEGKSRCGSETAKVGAKATYKTSTSSVVLSLPPVMKNFVETRDGMGNVVVSTASLKSKFSNRRLLGISTTEIKRLVNYWNSGPTKLRDCWNFLNLRS